MSFKTITIKPLHPTFVAEIQGVDFTNLSDETFSEIVAALAKVIPPFNPFIKMYIDV